MILDTNMIFNGKLLKSVAVLSFKLSDSDLKHTLGISKLILKIIVQKNREQNRRANELPRRI